MTSACTHLLKHSFCLSVPNRWIPLSQTDFSSLHNCYMAPIKREVRRLYRTRAHSRGSYPLTHNSNPRMLTGTSSGADWLNREAQSYAGCHTVPASHVDELQLLTRKDVHEVGLQGKAGARTSCTASAHLYMCLVQSLEMFRCCFIQQAPLLSAFLFIL